MPSLQLRFCWCQTGTKQLILSHRTPWGRQGQLQPKGEKQDPTSPKGKTRSANRGQSHTTGKLQGMERAGTYTVTAIGRQAPGLWLMPLAHLFLISLLQELEVAPLLTVLAEGAVLVVQQAHRWGHASALWVHPGVDVVGDITSRDATHRMHRKVQLLAAFQYLEDKPRRGGS